MRTYSQAFLMLPPAGFNLRRVGLCMSNPQYTPRRNAMITQLIFRTARAFAIAEADSHSDEAATGQDGYVSFPERAVWSPAMIRILGPVWNVLGAGVHASFRRSAWIFPQVPGLQFRGERLPTYWGKDLPSQAIPPADAVFDRAPGFAKTDTRQRQQRVNRRLCCRCLRYAVVVIAAPPTSHNIYCVQYGSRVLPSSHRKTSTRLGALAHA